jgi:hypothetical protein
MSQYAGVTEMRMSEQFKARNRGGDGITDTDDGHLAMVMAMIMK